MELEDTGQKKGSPESHRNSVANLGLAPKMQSVALARQEQIGQVVNLEEPVGRLQALELKKNS